MKEGKHHMKNGDGKAAVEMVGLIRDLIIEELNKRDSTEVCKIATVNSDGTYNILIPPDDRNVIRNVKSISPDKLEQGDVAYIYKFLGKLNNAIIIAKIGANSSDLRFLTVDDIPLFEGSSSSGGGGGDVTDVLVNGTSVVDSEGVAHVADRYPTTFTWTSGGASGPTGSLTGNSAFTPVLFEAIPTASNLQSGVITTGNQTFSGNKTFSDHIKVNGDDDPYYQQEDYDLLIYGDRLEVYDADNETTTTLLLPITDDTQTLATLSDIPVIPIVDLTGL